MKVIDEGIKFKEKYNNIKDFSQDEVKEALDFIVKKIDENLSAFTYKFPSSSSVNNVYQAVDNINWTSGFWTGMVWLAYKYTGEEKYKKAAEIHCGSFKERIEKQIKVDHHDLGFLYSLSCVEGYKLTGSEEMKETAVKAAERLTARYKEKGEFIQAWGAVDDPEANRLIIDCMLNLPLLYWASEITGDSKYAGIAKKHANTSLHTVVREDSSTFHTFYFDVETGAPLKGVTCQGYSDDSAWARGQAWGIYGFALSYRYTKNKAYLEAAERLANYFLNRLPGDYVCFWDLIFKDGKNQERDSSAAAIAVCGMLEILKHSGSEYAPYYKKAVNAILRSLKDNYTTTKMPESNGILLHAVYAKPQNIGIDECSIWGDYYYMEALMRLHTEFSRSI